MYEGENLGLILRKLKLINKEVLIKALKYQKVKGGRVGEILVKMGAIRNKDLTKALALQGGIEFIDLSTLKVAPELLKKVTVKMARTYNFFPVKEENGTIFVAMADVDNFDVTDNLQFLMGTSVESMLCDPEDLREAIEKYYDSDQSLLNLIDNVGDDDIGEVAEVVDDATSIDKDNDVNSAPVINLLNYYLRQGIQNQASDIHLEPFEDCYKVRMRVDGALVELQAPPRNLAPALSARVKVMASMDIAELRMPQDNRIALTIGGRSIDLRVSTLPTKFGESVVMRVLDQSVVSLDIEQLGMREDTLKNFRRLIGIPNGIVLVTGPTGSGKTTTLYAALNDVNDIGDKIITTEDPIEYDLDGIMQVQVNSEIGLSFAACLRSILRQDPDKILVGEIRDLETARIAVDASLTGHLVFSTLHTNSASLTIARLVDMGIEPYSIAATVQAIMAQRLVRTICLNCKEQYSPTREILFRLGLKESELGGKKFFAGKGCEDCRHTGYKGRTAIYELLIINDQIKELILANEGANVIQDAAIKSGMDTLREYRIHLIYDGRTTIEEVLQATV